MSHLISSQGSLLHLISLSHRCILNVPLWITHITVKSQRNASVISSFSTVILNKFTYSHNIIQCIVLHQEALVDMKWFHYLVFAFASENSFFVSLSFFSQIWPKTTCNFHDVQSDQNSACHVVKLEVVSVVSKATKL